MCSLAADSFRYLPVGTRTMLWGLYVTGCGHLTLPPSGQHPPRKHPHLYRFHWDRGRVLPEYQLIYLTRGAGQFESTPTGAATIAAGDVFVLFPGVWHRYRPAPQAEWETHWVGLNGDYMRSLVDRRFLSPDRAVIRVGIKAGLVESYQRLVTLASDEDDQNPFRLAAGAMDILAWILAPAEPEIAQPATKPFMQPVTDRLVAEAVRFIWSQAERTMTVGDVVEHFPVARRSLERRFHRALGHTILDEIARCRVDRAKRLLQETDLPLKQVAYMAGFPTSQCMTKAFHREEDLAPTEYRRTHRPK
jgi:AraC-like DNA-binding protein